MLTTTLIFASLPVLLGGILWALQERMIFLPDSRPLIPPAGWQAETLRTGDGLDLVFLVSSRPAGAPVLLHFHGNGGNAGDRVGAFNIIARRGWTVVLAGYRGYGGNPGRPGEDAFARDALLYRDWVRARFPDAPLVLWGESLGTSVVTRLAEGDPAIAAVLLESPFTSVTDVAAGQYPWLPVRHLLRHPFESLARLANIAAPILIVASEDDRIVPVAQARRMHSAARDGVGVFLPGGAHPAILNDPSGEALRRALEFLAARVPAR